MTDETTTANDTLLKKKGKGKKSINATGETAVLDDTIISTAHELENLDRDAAYQLVPELTNNVDFNYFRLGGVLAMLQSKDDWWKGDGYENFRAFIEAKFGIQYRKAMYLIGIYGNLVESGVPWTKLQGIGWSKVKEIAPILTIDNVDEWVERANELTVLQLHEAVKKAMTGSLQKSDEEPEPDNTGVTTFNVKVHPDQKKTIEQAVEKAMKEAGTEFKGVALEAICMNYLSGAKVGKPKSLKDTLKAYDYETILKTFAEIFPEIDVSVSV